MIDNCQHIGNQNEQTNYFNELAKGLDESKKGLPRNGQEETEHLNLQVNSLELEYALAKSLKSTTLLIYESEQVRRSRIRSFFDAFSQSLTLQETMEKRTSLENTFKQVEIKTAQHINQLSSQLRIIEKHNAEYEEKIKEFEIQVDVDKQQINAQLHVVEALKAQLETTQSSLQLQKQGRQTLIEEHEASIAQCVKEIEDLKKTLKSSKFEIESIKVDIMQSDHVKKKFKEAESALSNTKARLDEKEDELSQMTLENKKLKMKLNNIEDLQRKLSKSELERDITMQKMKEYLQTMKEYKIENDYLKKNSSNDSIEHRSNVKYTVPDSQEQSDSEERSIVFDETVSKKVAKAVNARVKKVVKAVVEKPKPVKRHKIAKDNIIVDNTEVIQNYEEVKERESPENDQDDEDNQPIPKHGKIAPLEPRSKPKSYSEINNYSSEIEQSEQLKSTKSSKKIQQLSDDESEADDKDFQPEATDLLNSTKIDEIKTAIVEKVKNPRKKKAQVPVPEAIATPTLDDTKAKKVLKKRKAKYDIDEETSPKKPKDSIKNESVPRATAVGGILGRAGIFKGILGGIAASQKEKRELAMKAGETTTEKSISTILGSV